MAKAKPKRKSNLSVGLPRNKWVNARIRVTSGGKIQATVDENILGNLFGKSKKNPHRRRNPLKISPLNKEIYERKVKPRLRSPYNLLPWAVYRRTKGKGMYVLFKDGQIIKGGSKSALKKYARREAGF